MFLRLTVFLLMAAGLIGFGSVAYLSTRPPRSAQAALPPMESVLVAAHGLQAGTLLKPEDMAVLPVLRAAIPPGASPDTPAARGGLTGAMVRRSLATNEPIGAADIMRPGDHGFLAAVLASNMRAATVAVDAVSGTAGLIWPGDRVDLVLTQALDDAALPASHRMAGETVLSDVRVIAIDQQLVQGATPGAEKPQQARTVTLEVSPGQAERVAVATRLGKLSLVVRAAGASPTAKSADATSAPGANAPEKSPPEKSPIVWAGDVSPALAEEGVKQPPNTITIYSGRADGKAFRF